jgi:hypothetical protein
MQAITATSTKKGDLILGEIQSEIKNKGITVDVKGNSASNVHPSLSLSLYILVSDMLYCANNSSNIHTYGEITVTSLLSG